MANLKTIVKRATTGKSTTSSSSSRSTSRVSQEEIAKKAYEYFEMRGRSNGNDWDDWFKAERYFASKGKF